MENNLRSFQAKVSQAADMWRIHMRHDNLGRLSRCFKLLANLEKHEKSNPEACQEMCALIFSIARGEL